MRLMHDTVAFLFDVDIKWRPNQINFEYLIFDDICGDIGKNSVTWRSQAI